MLNFSQVMFSEIDVKSKIAFGSYNCWDVILTTIAYEFFVD